MFMKSNTKGNTKKESIKKGNTTDNVKTKSDTKMDAVKKGDKVQVHYTGTLSDGSTFDSSDGREPLLFEAGAGQVIPGFDNAILGMKMDQEKSFTIKSEDAYGPVNAQMVIEIPRERLPPKPEPQVGMQLMMGGPSGERMPALIAKVSGDKVTLDLNHPLAGKDLTFKVKVVGINNPNAMVQEDSCCGSGKCGSEGGCSGGGCGNGGCGNCGDEECSDEEEIDHTQ